MSSMILEMGLRIAWKWESENKLILYMYRLKCSLSCLCGGMWIISAFIYTYKNQIPLTYSFIAISQRRQNGWTLIFAQW